jgi:hypothetical protein
MNNRRQLTLTNSTIYDICLLVKLGVSPTAAALRWGIKKPTFDYWRHIGHRHLSAGLPTMQARLVQQLEEAQRVARHINWDRMQQEHPTAWLALQATKLFNEECASKAMTPEQQAQRQQLERDLYNAWFAQEGADNGTPDSTR